MPMKKYSCDQIEQMIADLAFPEYRELKECRDVVDDCLAGQRTIKEKCKYLPANDWQKTHDDHCRRLVMTAGTSCMVTLVRRYRRPEETLKSPAPNAMQDTASDVPGVLPRTCRKSIRVAGRKHPQIGIISAGLRMFFQN